jgi:hypothetical protein
MHEQKNNRTKWLHLRLSPQEYERLYKEFSKTTCRKLSDYSRKILLGKPVVATYRNQSLDDFMTEVMQLRSELNSIGNNFNQVVKKLHSLNQVDEMKGWFMTYESGRMDIFHKIDQIKLCINKIADQWLQ